MPVPAGEIIDVLSKLAEEEQLKVTVKECVKGGLIIAVSSAIGGLLLGPAGLAVGGVISSCSTAFSYRNKFSSVVQILADMEPDRREELAENVRHIMDNLNVQDAVVFAGLLAGNITVRRQVTTELINFINNEINMAIANH